MSLKLAIWDMDGTIVDSRHIIQTAMERAFERLGLEPPAYDDTRKHVGLSLDTVIANLAPDLDSARLSQLAEAYKTSFITQRTEPDFKEPLYDGAVETLARLANEGWVLGVATGKARRGLRAIFDMHPLEQYFDTVWCADDGPGKPHPFMIEQNMSAVGAKAGHTLIIGDAIHDMVMGRAAGVRCKGVSWGFGAADELHEAGAHEVHDSFDTLNESLDRFAGDLAELSS